MSLPRRLSLLGWTNAADAYVIEDDYDSEFRFVGRPLPALKSLDREQRVIYAGSFSKTLFPGLRLGYLVLPDRLLGQFVEASATRTAGHGLFEQRVVAAFMKMKRILEDTTPKRLADGFGLPRGVLGVPFSHNT